MSAVLATIKTDVPMDVTLDDLVPRGIQEDPLRELFERWEFGMVARKLLPAKQSIDRSVYKAIVTDQEVDSTLAAVREAGRVAVSMRTTGKHWLGVALTWGENDVAYIPLQPRMGVHADVDASREKILELFADPSVKKLGHDLKPILRTCLDAGASLKGIEGDSRLLDYVLVAHRRSHGLADIAQRHLGHTLAYEPPSEPL